MFRSLGGVGALLAFAQCNYQVEGAKLTFLKKAQSPPSAAPALDVFSTGAFLRRLGPDGLEKMKMVSKPIGAAAQEQLRQKAVGDVFTDSDLNGRLLQVLGHADISGLSQVSHQVRVATLDSQWILAKRAKVHYYSLFETVFEEPDGDSKDIAIDELRRRAINPKNNNIEELAAFLLYTGLRNGREIKKEDIMNQLFPDRVLMTIFRNLFKALWRYRSGESEEQSISRLQKEKTAYIESIESGCSDIYMRDTITEGLIDVRKQWRAVSSSILVSLKEKGYGEINIVGITNRIAKILKKGFGHADGETKEESDRLKNDRINISKIIGKFRLMIEEIRLGPAGELLPVLNSDEAINSLARTDNMAAFRNTYVEVSGWDENEFTTKWKVQDEGCELVPLVLGLRRKNASR